MTTTATPSIAESLKWLVPAGSVIELRALDCKPPRGGRPFVSSGYFKDMDLAAKAATDIERKYTPAGIYWTCNPVNPALLARSPNMMTDYPSNDDR